MGGDSSEARPSSTRKYKPCLLSKRGGGGRVHSRSLLLVIKCKERGELKS